MSQTDMFDAADNTNFTDSPNALSNSPSPFVTQPPPEHHVHHSSDVLPGARGTPESAPSANHDADMKDDSRTSTGPEGHFTGGNGRDSVTDTDLPQRNEFEAGSEQHGHSSSDVLPVARGASDSAAPADNDRHLKDDSRTSMGGDGQFIGNNDRSPVPATGLPQRNKSEAGSEHHDHSFSDVLPSARGAPDDTVPANNDTHLKDDSRTSTGGDEQFIGGDDKSSFPVTDLPQRNKSEAGSEHHDHSSSDVLPSARGAPDDTVPANNDTHLKDDSRTSTGGDEQFIGGDDKSSFPVTDLPQRNKSEAAFEHHDHSSSDVLPGAFGTPDDAARANNDTHLTDDSRTSTGGDSISTTNGQCNKTKGAVDLCGDMPVQRGEDKGRRDALEQDRPLGVEPTSQDEASSGKNSLPEGHAGLTDKLVGKTQKVIGKAMNKPEMHEKGELRAAGGKEAARGEAQAPHD